MLEVRSPGLPPDTNEVKRREVRRDIVERQLDREAERVYGGLAVRPQRPVIVLTRDTAPSRPARPVAVALAARREPGLQYLGTSIAAAGAAEVLVSKALQVGDPFWGIAISVVGALIIGIAEYRRG